VQEDTRARKSSFRKNEQGQRLKPLIIARKTEITQKSERAMRRAPEGAQM